MKRVPGEDNYNNSSEIFWINVLLKSINYCVFGFIISCLSFTFSIIHLATV